MKKANNKGFTFIELVLYIGILSIFMVAVTTLIGSVVASNRKMTSRKKIQNQAEEAYDTMSDMLMAAMDIKIYAELKDPTKGEDEKKEKRVYIKPLSSDKKMEDGSYGFYKEENSKDLESRTVDLLTLSPEGTFSKTSLGPCYDIGEHDKNLILVPVDKKRLYIKINYSSGLDSSGDSIITSCTLVYDKEAKKIYAYRMNAADPGGDAIVDATADESYVLVKNVEQFSVRVNPDEGSFAITMKLQDAQTAASYTVDSVVSLRNSNVLKAHSN